MKRHAMVRPALAALAIVAVIMLGAIVSGCTRRPGPPMATLDATSFEQLRLAFNASADRVRVVTLLSPT